MDRRTGPVGMVGVRVRSYGARMDDLYIDVTRGSIEIRYQRVSRCWRELQRTKGARYWKPTAGALDLESVLARLADPFDRDRARRMDPEGARSLPDEQPAG